MEDEDPITEPSRRFPCESIDRLTAGLEAKGVTIFARIDRAANAAAARMSLRPTDLLTSATPRGERR
jgi:uncharacterized protein (DUF302 family)